MERSGFEVLHSPLWCAMSGEVEIEVSDSKEIYKILRKSAEKSLRRADEEGKKTMEYDALDLYRASSLWKISTALKKLNKHDRETPKDIPKFVAPDKNPDTEQFTICLIVSASSNIRRVLAL